jgi:LuxR family maltose regulon positive regulatory protein
MLQSPQPPVIQEILVSLINEIASSPAQIILILDDYHLTGSSEIADGLSFLIEHQPPNFHLIIATREDPQLPLSRLRARGQLNELRATELRFTPSEAAEFLNKVMKLDISEKDIAALENRTEGWIAGLQLAAISIYGRENASDLIQAFTGSHRLVLDYLIEEVLKQQSENMQNFLLRTAVLDRMTGALCNTLTGREDGEATLEELEHANLFIVSLDEERRWYRYHHLFSDLLRTRLHKTQLEQEAELHQQASIWFEKNMFFDEAIEHAYHANDHGRVVDLIDKNSEAIWREGEHIKLRRWLAKIPKKLIISKPNLCILNAWDQFSTGHLKDAEQTLDNINTGDMESPQKKDAQPDNSIL